MNKTLDPSELYTLYCMYGYSHNINAILVCPVLKRKFFECNAMLKDPDLKTIGKLMYD